MKAVIIIFGMLFINASALSESTTCDRYYLTQEDLVRAFKRAIKINRHSEYTRTSCQQIIVKECKSKTKSVPAVEFAQKIIKKYKEVKLSVKVEQVNSTTRGLLAYSEDDETIEKTLFIFSHNELGWYWNKVDTCYR